MALTFLIDTLLSKGGVNRENARPAHWLVVNRSRIPGGAYDVLRFYSGAYNLTYTLFPFESLVFAQRCTSRNNILHLYRLYVHDV